MNPRYPEVAARASHRCEYCRAPEAAFNLAFEVKHIVPLSKGGVDTLENLALACRSCNLHKGARLTCADPETGQQVALFHPRRSRRAFRGRPGPGVRRPHSHGQGHARVSGDEQRPPNTS